MNSITIFNCMNKTSFILKNPMPQTPVGLCICLTQLCFFPAHEPVHGSTWRCKINTPHCIQTFSPCAQAVFSAVLNAHLDLKQQEPM